MSEETFFIYSIIAVLSILNFFRMFIYLISSDVYDIQQIMKGRVRRRPHRPLISVIIPAYNEEVGVIRTVESVLASSYKNKEVIIVNDGSKDRTLQILRNFQRKNRGTISIVNQENADKAAALNNGIRNRAKGSLVMVLDADSILHPDALQNMAEHFRDKKILAAASNVKIIPSKSGLGLSQRIEYLISYRMKRALSTLNMEYIIGGVGSTFRKKQLIAAGGYDTDTMTEDIDLTVKLIRIYGNKKYRITYASDSIAYTEHVLNLRSLIKQRFRWKFGRFQTLLKNKSMFFNASNLYDKRLTWFQLPYAIFGEIVLLLEPLLVGYIIWITVMYADLTSLGSVYLIVSAFIFLILIGEDTETFRSKLLISLVLPTAYVLMYILAIVEFAALIKSIAMGKKLLRRDKIESSWEHVERSGGEVSIPTL